MVLITTNILIHVLSSVDMDFEDAAFGLIERLTSLLCIDPSLRLITCVNIAKTILLITKSSQANRGSAQKFLGQALKRKAESLTKIYEHDDYKEVLITEFMQAINSIKPDTLLDPSSTL